MNVNFYNVFHKYSSIQYKPISKNNFTYRILLGIFGKEVSSKNILDYGCGSGTLALYLASLGNNVIGIDISSKAIEFAKESASNMKLDKKCVFYTLQIGSKIIRKEKFDLILCIEVLEHVRNDSDLIEMLSSCLSKNGKLIVSVPSLNAPLYRLGLLNGFDKRVGHLRRYSKDSIIKLLSISGLKITQCLKSEGIIRNALFTFPRLGFFIKFAKGVFGDLITIVDNWSVSFLGESDLILVSRMEK